METISPSFVHQRSNSISVAPSATAEPNAGRLFSGATVLKPRCAQRRLGRAFAASL